MIAGEALFTKGYVAFLAKCSQFPGTHNAFSDSTWTRGNGPYHLIV